MIRQPISGLWSNALCFLAIVAMVGAYMWLSHTQHEKNPKDTTIPTLLPATYTDPITNEQVKVNNQMWEGWLRVTTSQHDELPWLYQDLWASVSRHVGGLFIGSLAAVIVGIAMSVSRYAESFFWLPVFLLSKVPPTAMMAVYFVLFGTEYTMFVAMIALGIFPTLCQAVYQAATKDVAEDDIHKTYTLGGSNIEVIETIFNISLPRIIEAVRLQLGPALVFLIAAELLVADVGFGYRLRIQSRLLNMNVVYIYLAILAVSFTLMDIFFQVMRRITCKWYGE